MAFQVFAVVFSLALVVGVCVAGFGVIVSVIRLEYNLGVRKELPRWMSDDLRSAARTEEQHSD